MSIDMENPTTILEKADALTNLVEQMFLAHQIKDEKMFNEAHDRAHKMGFELTNDIEEAGIE